MDEEENGRDLDFEVIEKVFSVTSEKIANLFLWCGKTMINKNWDALTDLIEKDPDEIWNGAEFIRLRETIRTGLMPVCSKCVLLYLNGTDSIGSKHQITGERIEK